MDTILVLDVEAINLDKPYIYDIGFIIAQREGMEYKPIASHSFVIKQVYDNKLLFNTAYYNNKRKLYTNNMRARKAYKKYWGHVARFMDKLVKLYDVKRVYAYNASFDKRAIEITSKTLKTYLPLKNVVWRDIMAIASEYIHTKPDYKSFCKGNNGITPKGYLKTNAEKTYQYLLNDVTFKEEHTGLQDVLIELDILNYCVEHGYTPNKEYRKKFIKAL